MQVRGQRSQFHASTVYSSSSHFFSAGQCNIVAKASGRANSLPGRLPDTQPDTQPNSMVNAFFERRPL